MRPAPRMLTRATGGGGAMGGDDSPRCGTGPRPGEEAIPPAARKISAGGRPAELCTSGRPGAPGRAAQVAPPTERSMRMPARLGQERRPRNRAASPSARSDGCNHASAGSSTGGTWKRCGQPLNRSRSGLFRGAERAPKRNRRSSCRRLILGCTRFVAPRSRGSGSARRTRGLSSTVRLLPPRMKAGMPPPGPPSDRPGAAVGQALRRPES